jgi:uncharacterized membrane protein
MQSIITFGALAVISIVLSFIPYGWTISWIISIGSLILWIICMVKAYQRQKFKLPIAGDMAEKYA